MSTRDMPSEGGEDIRQSMCERAKFSATKLMQGLVGKRLFK